MTDVTLRIKNLSISLEALSRINHEGASSLYVAIQALLATEIDTAQEEQTPRSIHSPTHVHVDDDM